MASAIFSDFLKVLYLFFIFNTLYPSSRNVNSFIFAKQICDLQSFISRLSILSFRTFPIQFRMSVFPSVCQALKVIESLYHSFSILHSLTILFLKNEENPLSVYGLNMRTTSSLESLNSVLGRLIPKRPNIFKFVDGIKIHEFTKHRELLELSFHCPKNQLKREKKRDAERDEQ